MQRLAVREHSLTSVLLFVWGDARQILTCIFYTKNGDKVGIDNFVLNL